jgi:hypothetical protein
MSDRRMPNLQKQALALLRVFWELLFSSTQPPLL